MLSQKEIAVKVREQNAHQQSSDNMEEFEDLLMTSSHYHPDDGNDKEAIVVVADLKDVAKKVGVRPAILHDKGALVLLFGPAYCSPPEPCLYRMAKEN